MSGTEQMALDEMLLEKSINQSITSPSLRFYTWKGGPWLSIGHHQKKVPKEWIELSQKNKLQLVRRPTGGSAVLHSGGLTYSIIWPSPPRKKREAYLEASQWLIKGFSDLGVSLHFGKSAQVATTINCFSSSTSADLIDEFGQKRVGSAQLWRQRYLLQHGEILLDPPRKLWMEVFESMPPEPAPVNFPRKGLEKALQQSIQKHWPKVKWKKEKLTKNDLSELGLRAQKYLLRFDQSSLTIPPEIILSTT